MKDYSITTKTILGNINVTYIRNFGETPHIGVEMSADSLHELQVSFQTNAELYKISLV